MLYYKWLILAYRKRVSNGGYPSIIINSMDVKELLKMVEANDWAGLTQYLVGGLDRLSRAGADFAIIAANTPHLVFDAVQSRSSIPLLSIVDATCARATKLGLKKVGLLGTRFLMQAKLYPQAFSRAGISIVIPEEDEQGYVHDKYVTELVNGILLPETKRGLLATIARMKSRNGIEGVILGGTELSLILGDVIDEEVVFLDTTRIHVDAAVTAILS